jgi:hypothetical protein
MPRIRKYITITVAPRTLDNFDVVELETGLPRGRIVDYLVEKEAKKLQKLAGATKAEVA